MARTITRGNERVLPIRMDKWRIDEATMPIKDFKGVMKIGLRDARTGDGLFTKLDRQRAIDVKRFINIFLRREAKEKKKK
jgi:hypothetical protein